MKYPITTNTEMLKRFVEFYIPVTSEDRESAVKAIVEIEKYIAQESQKVAELRHWIGGGLSIFDSEIDEELSNRLATDEHTNRPSSCC